MLELDQMNQPADYAFLKFVWENVGDYIGPASGEVRQDLRKKYRKTTGERCPYDDDENILQDILNGEEDIFYMDMDSFYQDLEDNQKERLLRPMKEIFGSLLPSFETFDNDLLQMLQFSISSKKTRRLCDYGFTRNPEKIRKLIRDSEVVFVDLSQKFKVISRPKGYCDSHVSQIFDDEIPDFSKLGPNWYAMILQYEKTEDKICQIQKDNLPRYLIQT